MIDWDTFEPKIEPETAAVPEPHKVGYKTFLATPQQYKQFVKGQPYLMLAGKFRPVTLVD